jgi:hypothetical protein
MSSSHFTTTERQFCFNSLFWIRLLVSGLDEPVSGQRRMSDWHRPL